MPQFNCKKSTRTGKSAVRAILIFSAALFLFTACSTTVPVTVTRPADLDITDANDIAVLPFLTSRTLYYTDYQSDPIATFDFYWNEKDKNWYWDQQNEDSLLAELITENLEKSLCDADYLNVVSASKVENAYRKRTDLPIDWYVTGAVTNLQTFTKEDGTKEVKRKNSRGEYEIYEIPMFVRNLEMTLVYQVVDVRTGVVLSSDSCNYTSTSSRAETVKELPSALDMAKKHLSKFNSKIMKDFAPYTDSYSLTLMKHSDSEMKDAEKLAKKKNLKLAYNEYYSIYKTKGYYQAAYNAGLMAQAMGDYDQALKLFNTAYKESGDSTINSAIKQVKSEIHSAERLHEQNMSF